MFLKKEFRLGNAILPSNIFYAPLAGCSDYPFRRMSARYKPGLMFCEMVKMDALIRLDKGTLGMLHYSPEMHPIGAQLCGSKEELAAPSAKIVEDLGFTSIDFNCGCPVDKITKDGCGSALLKTPQKIGEILSRMVEAVKIPVTVKIRAGWDDHQINSPLITKIAEQAGAKAICIHGRTREQAYRGFANWDHIRACKEAASTILVIGNGDLFTPQDVKRMFVHTKCDGVLLSRGTMGNPWIAQDIYAYLQGIAVPQRNFQEQLDGLLAHYEEIKSYYNERKVLIDMRRVGCWYIKRGVDVRELRQIISHAQTLEEIEELLKNLKHQ